jgi:hypothetical protein
MRFKMWIEGEAPLGANMPDMLASVDPNRGSDTPASAEVKRTGLQPQVDAQEIQTKEKVGHDKLMAIDANIERFDKELPGDDDGEAGSKINKFKTYWNELKEKWDKVKMGQDDATDDSGLGDQHDGEYEQMMRDHPNMVPAGQSMPAGAGFMGT